MSASVPFEFVGPVSDVQAGMLYQSLLSPEAGYYVEQAACALRGELDIEAFREAWHAVMSRHQMLRAAFTWEGLSQPLMVVWPDVEVPLEVTLDHRESSAVMAEHRTALALLDRAPLFRLTLLKGGTDSLTLIWSIHHLIQDAHSLERVLRDMMANYERIRAGKACTQAPAPAFSDFVRWQRAQIRPEARDFWARELGGVRGPSQLPISADTTTIGDVYGCTDCFLTPEETLALQSKAAAMGVTLNTVMLGAWATTLAQWTRESEVLFGSVISVRDPVFPDVEDVVGPLITTLPLHVRPENNVSWLQRLQTQHAAMLPWMHTPLRDMQAAAGLDTAQQLLSSVLVFQNLLDNSSGQVRGTLEIGSVSTHGQPGEHLLARVTPGERIRLELVFHRSRLSQTAAGTVLQQFRTAVGNVLNTENRVPAPSRLQSVRPRARSVDASRLFERRKLSQAGTSVEVIEAVSSDMDLSEWAAAHQNLIAEALAGTGGLLLRGFRPLSSEGFAAVLPSLIGDPLDYRERSSPRARITGNVFSSTAHPADHWIPPHNENSYAHVWPLRIAFFCVQPATTGGATPVTDVGGVWRDIPEAVRERFEQVGVMYSRNLGGGAGLSWQEVFQTEERAVAESRCRQAGYSFEWRRDCLRTLRRAPAVALHPETRQPLWFNHAAFFHVTSLEPELCQALRAQYADEDLPNQTWYGDGTPIADEAVGEVRSAYQRNQLTFEWKRGDLLLLDNMRVAHAREPFTGDRQTLVGMAGPMSHEDLENLHREGFAHR